MPSIPETATDVPIQFSPNAQDDWGSGALDLRLAKTLMLLSTCILIHVVTIKTGHPLGPLSPAGVENTHWFFRAADIDEVDGRPVLGNETSRGLLLPGRTLRALPDAIRPDRIYGPASWHETLGFDANHGFVSDPFHDTIHANHIHHGYQRDRSGRPVPG